MAWPASRVYFMSLPFRQPFAKVGLPAKRKERGGNVTIHEKWEFGSYCTVPLAEMLREESLSDSISHPLVPSSQFI